MMKETFKISILDILAICLAVVGFTSSLVLVVIALKGDSNCPGSNQVIITKPPRS